MKKIIIILVVLAVLAGSGYYVFILWPQSYEKSVLNLQKELESSGGNQSRTVLSGRYDFENAIKMLGEQKEFFKGMQEKILKFNAPLWGEDKQIQEDLVALSNVFVTHLAENQKQLLWARDAYELFEILNPESSTLHPEAFPRNVPKLGQATPATVGVFNDLWSKRMSSAKPLAESLFKEKPPLTEEAKFAELKSLWEEGFKVFAAILEYASTQNRNMSVGTFESLVKKQVSEVAKADKLDKFLSLLESTVIQNSAENIVHANPATNEDFNKRSVRLNGAMQGLKQKYGK